MGQYEAQGDGWALFGIRIATSRHSVNKGWLP